MCQATLRHSSVAFFSKSAPAEANLHIGEATGFDNRPANRLFTVGDIFMIPTVHILNYTLVILPSTCTSSESKPILYESVA